MNAEPEIAVEPWQIVENIKYPDYDTYRGPATEFVTEWNSLIDKFIDTHKFVTDLMTSIVTQFNQVKPIQVVLARRPEQWYGIWYIHYILIIVAHDSPIAPEVVAAILFIIEVAAIAIAAWIILNTAKDVIWGPPEVGPIVRAIIPLAILIFVGAWAYSKLKGVKK
jgi:hypothetical protein